jgi:hypothetical protein
MKLMRRSLCVLMLLGGVAACGEPKNKDPRAVLMTDTLRGRQRDSVIAESKLPGAKGVRRALDVSDAAAARVAPVDSLIR